MRSESFIQRKANELLRALGAQGPPVRVLEVAELLGAKVVPEIVDEGISGGLSRRPDGPVIGVNAQHHPNRQRFTIAHELGHLVLHEDADHFVDRTFHRDEKSGTATDTLEIEANKFAAALLMPKVFLSEDLKGKPMPLRSEQVEEMAREYGVSQQAMTFRLMNLGVQLDQS